MGEAKLSLHDLIVEIHALDRKLQTLEEKYSLLSEDFYQLYEAGRFRDDELEEIDELGRWAAWWRMRTRRVTQYEAMKNAFFAQTAHSTGIALKPYSPLREVA